MNKLLPLIFALSVFGGSTVHGMPVAPLASSQANLTIQVGGGCGLGVRRGPLGECAPVYVYRGYNPYYRSYVRGYYRGYRRGYYEGYHDARYPYVRYYGGGDVIAVTRGACGFGSYLRCSYGTCWRVCY